MIYRYKHIILPILLSIWTVLGWAQVPQTTWVINTDESAASKNYVARESIKLQTGTTTNFHFKATTGNSFSAKIDAGLLFPPTTNTYATPNGDITPDLTQGGVVGGIPGQFGVSPSGVASYSIPIECPSGINGMQPKVALAYNSQGGNAIAGWGWNIGGMSSIVRTGSNLYNDGKTVAPQLTAADNLMLDGQRLLLISGNNLTEGAKYRTEIETYSDITFKTINGVQCFQVQTKEGTTMEFGSTADSYIEAQNSTAALTWLLTKVTDANGNYMTYSYGEDHANGEFWLDKIKYTYNTAAGITTAANEIDFIYTIGRADSQTSYIVGNKTTQSRLLQSIKTFTNSEPLPQREYDLTYSSDGFYNKLATITETGNNGIKYNPTVIDWSKLNSSGPPSFGFKSSSSPLTLGTIDESALFVDFNNDGFSDLIRPVLDPLTGEYTGWEIYRSSNNGQNFTFNQKENVDNSNNFPFFGQYQLLPGDFNSDGISDILEIRGNSSIYQSSYDFDILLNEFINGDRKLVRQNLSLNITGEANTKFNFDLGDYNADGTLELLAKKTNSSTGTNTIYMYAIDLASKTLTLLSTTNTTQDLTVTRRTDVNGNGYPEIFTGSKFLEYNSISNAFIEIPFVHNLNTLQYDLEFGDINGDGKTDVLVYDHNLKIWALKLSTGVGFVDIACPLTRARTYSNVNEQIFNDDYFLSDYNGDGKMDILESYPNNGSNVLNIYYFNGNNFIKGSYDFGTSSLGLYFNRTLPYYDINGDGKCDLVGSSIFGVSSIFFSTNETERSVSTITNGMNIKNTIVYKSLSDSTVYSIGTTPSTKPVVKLCVPMSVVSQSITSAGNLSETINYNYEGLKIHTLGKGMLGFDKFTEDNVTQNKKSVTQFGYNSTFFNTFPTQQTVSTSSGQLISTTSYTNILNNLGGKRIFPYVSAQTSTDNLTGISANTIYPVQDDYGNTIVQQTTTGSVVETMTTLFIQKGSWCPNKPQQITQQKQVGSEIISRVSQFIYDTNGNLTKEIVDPADVNSVINEYKNYDYFGHALLATTTSNGIVRNTTSTYTPSGRFLLSKTNVLGESTNYSWDENKGQLNSETNRFGTTYYTYNGFGSLVETKLPDGIRKSQIKQWASPNNSIGAKCYDYTETSGSVPVTVWYDALGHTIQKDSYGLNNKQISVTTEYYTNGQVYRVSDPYFVQDAASKTWAKTITYDDYGRPLTLTTPMGGSSTVYNGKITTVTTPEGSNETTVNDAGQTVTNKVNGKGVAYTYYASGLTKTSTPEGGQAIAMEYNLQGKRTKLTDPDAGIVESTFNGFGELTQEKQKVHNATDYIITTNSYTTNGLLQSILRNGETTTYTYDGNNRISTIEIAGKNKQTFTYDNFDRITNIKEEIGANVYNSGKEYDYFGRVKKEIYPSGFYVLNSYDSYSNLIEVKDNVSRSIWKPIDENARGQLLNVNKGGKITTFGFDSRGFPLSIFASGVEDMSYLFNTKGNLSYRTDNLTAQNEQFQYDGLNRLTNWDVYKNGVLAKQNSITFDPTTSNIIAKSDIGNFAMNYGEKKADGTNCGPHALTTIMNVPTNFPTADLNVTYTDFKKIATLSEGTKNYALTYGADDQRRMSVYSVGGVVQQTRYYVGDYEEEVNTFGNVRKIHYLSGGAMLIQNNGVDSLLYAYSDFQGSLIALTDVSGNVVEKYAYDPWGARRNPTDWTQKDLRTKWITNRGYTGHEHLDAFGIINMNGRVYDPLTAMFMSPDPYVQAPGDWLNYNRYGYCFGNPFKYTDPSGNWAFWDDLVAIVGGGLINMISNWHSGISFGQALSYFVAGAVAGEATLYEPGAATAIASGLGATNSTITQGFKGNTFSFKNINLNSVLGAGAMGAITAYAGGQVGNAMHLDKVLGGISSPLVKNVVGGEIGGTIMGGAFGGLSAVANGQDFGKGVWSGAKMGFVTGTISGFSNAVQFADKNNVNLFSGKPNPVMERAYVPQPLPTPKVGVDESNGFDVKTTLYRGTTGSEQDSGPLFMTDDPDYASSYVKNGGSVQQVTMPRSTLNQMLYNGDCSTFNGYNSVGGSTIPVIEYKFSPQMKPLIVPNFQPFNPK